MMGTEIFKIDASWAEKWTKTRVSFLSAPTVASERFSLAHFALSIIHEQSGLFVSAV